MLRLPIPFPLVLGVAATATTGCALVMDVDFDGYHEAPGSQQDGGGGSAGAAGIGGSGGDDAGACAPRLVINELQTAGPNGVDDEFVELYNAGDCPADLTGTRLVYRSSSATLDHGVTWDADDGVVLASGSRYVIGGATFSLTPDSKFPNGFSLSASGGGLAIRAGGEVLDQLGWGDATNEFVNQLAAVAPASGMSIARHPDGHDTNDDMKDLTEGVPTPGAANGP